MDHSYRIRHGARKPHRQRSMLRPFAYPDLARCATFHHLRRLGNGTSSPPGPIRTVWIAGVSMAPRCRTGRQPNPPQSPSENTSDGQPRLRAVC